MSPKNTVHPEEAVRQRYSAGALQRDPKRPRAKTTIFRQKLAAHAAVRGVAADVHDYTRNLPHFECHLPGA